MCNMTDNVRNKVRVSYNIKSDGSKLNCKSLFSIFSGDLPEGLFFYMTSDGEFVEINYYSNKFVLFSEYLENNKICELNYYVKKFCEFILDSGDNSYLLDLNQIFCDESGLYFIPSLLANEDSMDSLQTVKCFLKNIADISNEYAEKIETVYKYADNSDVSVEDILNYIDRFNNEVSKGPKIQINKALRRCPKCGSEYEQKYLFCMKCGCKLLEVEEKTNHFDLEIIHEIPRERIIPQEENKNQKNIENEIYFCEDKTEGTIVECNGKTETIDDINLEKAKNKNFPILGKGNQHDKKTENFVPRVNKSPYGETTLLGFTNYGETSVLNGMASSFDTPNLIRKSTNEKIYITKRTFIIGKSADKVDYAVNNNAVSRIHAEISAVGSEYYVTDKDSTNHTYVNNSVIQSYSPYKISEGDEIMFANEIFIFYLQ